MVASTRSPLKTLLAAAGLSISLTILGCVSNGLSSSAPQRVLPLNTNQNSNQTANQAPAAVAAQANSEYRSDWSSDRIIRGTGDFKTASFASAIRPSLDLPAPERDTKQASTSGGLTNVFAKDLPGAESLSFVPNTPVVIGETSYFLTGSDSSVNFYALQSNGQVQWELSLHDNGKFDDTSAGLGNAGGSSTLYAISDTGRLYAVAAASGLVKSFVDIPEEEFRHSSPFVIQNGVGTSDFVYLASAKGKVYRYTFDGNTFSAPVSAKPVSSALAGKFSASPVVTALHVYVGSEEGKFYKLDRNTLATISTLDLSTTPRADGCQTMATLAIDATQDVGVVPCGSYLFKVRLNDASATPVSLAAQSPLLELPGLITLKTPQILGPNFNNRALVDTTLLREPKPTDTTVSLEQTFGFQKGDYLQVQTQSGQFLYGEIETITNEGAVTFKGEGLEPIPSPSPDPLLIGAEKARITNLVVRPTPFPSPDATPTPTPTPTPVGADPVTQFAVGRPENLAEGDLIRFPTLPGEPVVEICSASNANCDKDGTNTNRYKGLELFNPDQTDTTSTTITLEEAVTRITVPGAGLKALIDAAMAVNNYVPFEKVQNQVIGSSNSTVDFALGSVQGFKVGDTVRIMHRNNSQRGRYEYSVVSAVNTTTKRLTLSTALSDAPANGDTVEIIEPNDRAFGRVTVSQRYSSGNIISEPVLRGNGQQAYVQHGNTLFELSYNSDASFKDSANYLILQAGRLSQNNQALSALTRSSPLIFNNDKLVTVDADPQNKSGIFVNRVLLPLSNTSDRLNDIFAILAPNSIGQLSNRAETQPVLLGTSGFFMIGGGNGIAYKLHKDVAW